MDMRRFTDTDTALILKRYYCWHNKVENVARDLCVIYQDNMLSALVSVNCSCYLSIVLLSLPRCK